MAGILLAGSCRCGAVGFKIVSHTPYPYQLCYCTICCKTQGGGGYAINIMGDTDTLEVTGKEHLGSWHAQIEVSDGHGGTRLETSPGARHFCTRCASELWVSDPRWPAWLWPFASAIDTELPAAPERVHLMLKYKASWVPVERGPRDQCFDEYPEESIEEWHRKRGLWIE